MNQRDYVLTEEPYSKILDLYDCILAVFLCLALQLHVLGKMLVIQLSKQKLKKIHVIDAANHQICKNVNDWGWGSDPVGQVLATPA